MKIKMRTLAAGPQGTMEPGKVYTVDDAEGQSLINGRYAQLAEEPVKGGGKGGTGKKTKNNKSAGDGTDNEG